MTQQNSTDLRKVAFVAMPFRTRPTDLAQGKGPTTVNFDGLWERAIFPALEALGYIPIRADHQTGSVIVKDMLDQLVLADLVLADVSITNGNVYYEAGVRHAARERGCILMAAEWARPLFDLEQIRQLRYPLNTEEPSADDYDAIRTRLVEGIPQLRNDAGPVFTLTSINATDADSSRLKEVSSRIFNFQTDLRTAKLEADGGNKDSLRELLGRPGYLHQLPSYALEELVEAVRDHLNWIELRALIEDLPEVVRSEPFFREQEVFALANTGELTKAIALMQSVIEKYGETAERWSTIGGRYRELADQAIENPEKRRHRSNAIKAYRRGMQLNLNEYYCAHKLLVVLLERNRFKDAEEARDCAHLVKAACERARQLNRGDEWLEPTELIHAFVVRDYDRAMDLSGAILDRAWANWKQVGLVRDLEAVLAGNKEPEDSPLYDVVRELRRPLPIPQKELARVVLPIIKESGDHFRKHLQVEAKPATEGEVVVSRTSSGEETTNRAGPNHMLVRNLTKAQELYLVRVSTFNKRYRKVEDIGEGWARYDPQGEVRGLEITHDLTTRLGVGSRFYIMAPWGTEQLACEGNYLVSTLPSLEEVYRIDRQEFEETYQKVES